jgi:hypothetical protein
MHAGDVSMPMANALIITAVADKEKHGNRLPGLSPAALWSTAYSFAIKEINSEKDSRSQSHSGSWALLNGPGAQGTQFGKGVPVHNFLQSVALL